MSLYFAYYRRIVIPDAPPVPPLSPSTAFVCQNVAYVAAAALVVGNFVLLSSRVVGGVDPTVANLNIDGNFELASARITAIAADHITLQHSSTLMNDASSATADTNALNTYGARGVNIYHQLAAAPADGGPGPQFLVARLALHDVLQNLVPVLPPAIPLAAPLPAPPVPQDNVALQILANSKITPLKATQTQRLHQLAGLLPAGRFPPFILSFMFNLPDGQEPTAGYISFHDGIKTLRDFLYHYAQFNVSRTLTISDTKLTQFLLLNFIPSEFSLIDLATPSDLPLSFLNIDEFVNRVCEMLAIFYDPPLPMAILESVKRLVNFKRLLDCPNLTPNDVLELINRKIYLIEKSPLFDVNQPNGLDLETRLRDYFFINYNDKELKRLEHARNAAAAERDAVVANSKPPNPNPNPNPNKRSRKTSAPALVSSTAPSTRSQTVKDKENLLKWHAQLITTVPALANIPLPCLYWLSNKAPCLQNAVCQKITIKKPHVISPIVQTHMAAILAWLKLDPLGRF